MKPPQRNPPGSAPRESRKPKNLQEKVAQEQVAPASNRLEHVGRVEQRGRRQQGAPLIVASRPARQAARRQGRSASEPGVTASVMSSAPGIEPAAGAVRLERRYRFSASHLYRRVSWSEEQNRQHFGKCANLPGHGHNYRLYVSLRGIPDPQTAFIVDLPWLDALVTQRVLDRLDHQHLNSAIPEFGPDRLNPSSEALVTWIQSQLAPHLPPGLDLVRLRLEEDEDLAAEWHLADQPPLIP